MKALFAATVFATSLYGRGCNDYLYKDTGEGVWRCDTAAAAGQACRDDDSDGFGDPTDCTNQCDFPRGYAPNGDDCDDANPDANPDADEVCDGVDNNCDGAVDEGGVSVWYADADGDGYGDPALMVEACEPSEGWVANDQDCDDTNRRSYPGAVEFCDGLDNDCDGDTDEEAIDPVTWYADADGDGFGDHESTAETCGEQPTGFVDDDSDCDDSDPDVNADATEVCDGVDNNCDGLTDEDAVDATAWYGDGDGDGYGDPSYPTLACDPPLGHVANDEDCDDTRSNVNPGEIEVCDEFGNVDEDCNGLIDDADDSVDLTAEPTYYVDSDGDGYGDSDYSDKFCEVPSGYAGDDQDCDDADPAVNPGAVEDDGNGIDDDCDGFVDEGTDPSDDDGDGFSEADGDCNDADPAVNPGAVEWCDAADIDEDCNGLADDADPGVAEMSFSNWYADADGDGCGDPAENLRACDEPSGYVGNDSDIDDTDPSVCN